ncbi:unnamed protein product [marine sediment metagenome]|uniref:Uncharacterized protein n=1 Tax=marine sediment metagenome TaxID=412755 RepID=X1BBQ6_9ZZZZ
MERMRASFANWQDDFSGGIKLGDQKSRINIDQQDKKAVISISLGKGITEFDAKIRTKKEGYNQDQLVVTTKEPAKGKIVISVNGKYLSINQSMLLRQAPAFAKASADRQDERALRQAQDETHAVSYQSSSFHTGQTLEHALNIDETNITYDDKEGVLLIEIPIVKEEDKTKKIEVKIKK